MKFLFSLLTALLPFSAFAQTDPGDGPGYKTMEEDTVSLKGYTLTTVYSSIKDALTDKKHPGKPTLQMVEMTINFRPGDSYLLTRKEEVITSVLLLYHPKSQFLVMSPGGNQLTPYPSPLQGDISETGANEILKDGYDPTARIRDGKLIFNNKQYTIIPNSTIKQAVVQLIRAQHWAGGR